MEEKYIVHDTYGDYELFNTLDKAEEYFNSTLEFWKGEEAEGFEKEKDNKRKLKSCEALFTAIIGILEVTKQIV